MEWKIVKAKNDQDTIGIIDGNKSIFIHSSYNPEREATRWVQKIILPDHVKKVFLIGMGLGYHIKALQEKYPTIQIEVWDFNNQYKAWLESNERVKKFINNKVNYRSSENLTEINKQLFERINEKDTELLIHKPSLLVIPEKLYYLKGKLEDILFVKESIADKQEKLKLNFQSNIRLNDPGVSTELTRYKNKAFLLISAGPSLSKQLPIIKEMDRDNIIIGAVGTALKPLLLENIKPDFVMISDPLDSTYKQIEGILTKDLTLFYLSTANHMTVSNFQGKRVIVWQEGYTEAESIASRRGDPSIDTGGSVATCLLDLMVKMGAEKIAFVGQDLAFTSGKSHAATATGYREIPEEFTSNYVDNYDRTGKVGTSRNLKIYLDWFERYINKNPYISFYNCTEGGAYIKGCKHVSLKAFYQQILNGD